MRFQLFPVVALAQNVELVIRAVRQSEEMLFGELLDVDVSAHGKIDERPRDVRHVGRVVDQRP